jgi:hypothetical protein
LDAKQQSSQEAKLKKASVFLSVLAASLLCDKMVFPARPKKEKPFWSRSSEATKKQSQRKLLFFLAS